MYFSSSGEIESCRAHSRQFCRGSAQQYNGFAVFGLAPRSHMGSATFQATSHISQFLAKVGYGHRLLPSWVGHGRAALFSEVSVPAGYVNKPAVPEPHSHSCGRTGGCQRLMLMYHRLRGRTDSWAERLPMHGHPPQDPFGGIMVARLAGNLKGDLPGRVDGE